MSVFDTNEQQTQDGESYVQQLVKTKGDQWSDPEVIAKGKIDSDNHIQNLEEQLAKMREDLNKQEYSKELIERLQERQAPEAPAGNPEESATSGDANQGNTNPGVSEDQLKTLVEQTITSREQQNTEAQNVSQVDAYLEETFGTDAKGHVEGKAKELGMSVQRMRALAAESPAAFLALIGEAPEEPFRPMVQGSTNSGSLPNSGSSGQGERNFAFYEAMRRSDKRRYFSPQVQQQMVADRTRLGERFY